MNKTLFIIVCILALITVIVYTFVASAIHRKELCQKSPYYFCDTNWYCCKAGSDNCALNMNSSNSYKISDQFYNTSAGNPSGQTPLQCADGTSTGLNYFQSCIQPVQEFTKYVKPSDTANLSCLYDKTLSCSSAQAILSRSTNPITITAGQCCYKKIDYPTSTDGSSSTVSHLYPNASELGTWASQPLYGGYYSSNPNFVFPQGSTATNTKLNSCKNSLFGISGTYTTAQPYSGC